MRKLLIGAGVVVVLAGLGFYSGLFSRESTVAAGAAGVGPGGPAGAAGGFPGGRGGGRGPAGPMTVELAAASRGVVAQRLVVVGNLVGDATVSVVPRAAGRLQEVYVKLGDRVSRGQQLAKIEDQELREQIRQAEAAQEVSRATIRQREADLKLAETNVERSRSLFERQLLPKQTLDDNEARYQSAIAALDLARAQSTQSQARLEELRITMQNTVIVSPVNGFVARRAADPGAFASQNAPVVDVVDISRVRLVVNVVEKDLKQVQQGDTTQVEVDAFPGETFAGRIARVAPVLDPATRTAPIEIEIPNADFRLKPGMYARVGITTEQRPNALVVPSNALVDIGGERGVFIAKADNTAEFRKVEIGIEEPTKAEILAGLEEGERVVTTGAAALTDGAAFLVAGASGRNGRGARGGRGVGDVAQNGSRAARGIEQGIGAPSGTPPATGAASPGIESASPGSQSAPEGRRAGGRGRRGAGAPGQTAPATP
jgi:HlyD family secretion protein